MPAIFSDQSSRGESTYRSDAQRILDVVRSSLKAAKLKCLWGRQSHASNVAAMWIKGETWAGVFEALNCVQSGAKMPCL
jgi:hypothetical protein